MKSFALIPRGNEPCFSVAPHSSRMTSCYMDRRGIYHLFTDFVDAGLGTIHSWQAEIRRYDSADLKNWTAHGIAVAKGLPGEPDCLGAASPHIVCRGDRAYLFYSGRQNPLRTGRVDSLAGPGEDGYVSGVICMAIARLDEAGAPCGPFEKCGVVADNSKAWCAMRVDDPCAIVSGGKIHLYYKGFHKHDGGMPSPPNMSRSGMVFSLGYACADVERLRFERGDDPIFSVRGGCEMPRLFYHEGQLHLFLRHFDHDPGTASLWRHYRAEGLWDFTLVNPMLFDGAGDRNPGVPTAADMSLVYDADGGFTGMALACGAADGTLAQWHYDVRMVDV